MFPDGWQALHLGSAESIAGPRFDRELDVDLEFASVFDGLGRTRAYRESLAAIGNRLSAALPKSIGDNAPADLKTFVEVSQSVSEALREASNASATHPLAIESILASTERGLELAWRLRDAHRDRKQAEPGPEISDYVLHHVNKSADCLADAVELSRSRMARAAEQQMLLVTGPAGSGKTHLFLHVARERAAQSLSTVVVFGDRFSGRSHPREFTARLGLGQRYTLPEILSELEEEGKASNTRALLLIDAINETSPCEMWQEGLEWLEKELKERPHVCLAVSVRNGFESVAVTPALLERMTSFEHPGFARNLWEAMQAFFGHYEVQWPDVPLLGPEFSNPLFLKLFCVAFSGERPRSFRGHAGGTHIFEAYAKKVGPGMNTELGRPEAAPNHVWTDLIKPIATWMGEHGADEISVDEAAAIAEAAFPGRGGEALQSAQNHALLMESPRFNHGGDVDRYVLRFSYQKFSDHLVVRFLLNHYFNPDDPGRAFEKGSRLGRIVWLEEGQGLLEALAAQVSERTDGQHEITDFMPDETLGSWRVASAFLDSLVWRKPQAIGLSAIDYIQTVVFEDLRLVRNLFDVLISVASIPSHRLNARALHKLLTQWPLPERDQWWTGWLKDQYAEEGTAVDRLVSWARRGPGRESVEPEAALLLSIALSWLFTSPDRFLRDDATKAAVALLEHHPGVIPELLELFDSVDDPYVIERVYCAGFGALRRNPDGAALSLAARTLLDGLFSRSDNTHILTRDYARGIVELSVNARVIGRDDASAAWPPYGSMFPDNVPSKDELKAKYADDEGYVSEYGSIWHSVMEWDFGWYIIGTNSGSTPWSNRRIGEPPPLTREVRRRQFEQSLAAPAFEAYAAWREARSIDVQLLVYAAAGRGGEFERENKEPQAPIREAELRALLSPEEITEFEALLAADNKPVPDDTFDLTIEQAWVFQRCLDLGWTQERFGEADGQANWRRDSERKTERIGKKYQWIAHYEFLGLLADNYELKPGWGEAESQDYRGPWLDYERDIDPTCLADGLVHLGGPLWCCLPAYDPESAGPEDEEWLAITDDLPSPAGCIRLCDDDGDTWLSLEGSHEWRRAPAPGIDEYDVLHRRLWYEIQAYLLSASHVDDFMDWARAQDFMGRWMPENRGFSEIFLREFPDSEAFEDLAEESEPQRTGWVEDLEDKGLAIPLLVASDCYTGSSTDRDCSVKESFSVRLPSAPLVRGMGLVQDKIDGAWMRGDTLVAFDPSVGTDSARRLLVRQSALQTYLHEQRLSVVWTLLAAKEMLGGWSAGESRYARTEISGAYALGSEGVRGGLWVTQGGKTRQR